jgi:hypothetical protein
MSRMPPWSAHNLVSLFIDLQRFFLSTKVHPGVLFAAAWYSGLSLMTKVYVELKNQPTVLQSWQKALETISFELVT